MASPKVKRDPEGVIKHIQKRFGPIHTSFHEIVSDDLTIDIHHVKAKFLSATK